MRKQLGRGASIAVGYGVGHKLLPPSSLSNLIGGVAIGDAGTGIYSGFTLSSGDEFTALNIVSPANSRGKYFANRAYGAMNGVRGGQTGHALGVMYDTDPYMTGYRDSNRGVAAAFDNIAIVGGSSIKLQARKATTAERALIRSDNSACLQLAAAIHSAGVSSWYTGPSGTGEIIVEAMITYSAKATNPAGFHPTFWFSQMKPLAPVTLNNDEHDVEANSQGAYFNGVSVTNNTFTGRVMINGSVLDIMDGTPHKITLRFSQSASQGTRLYIDDVLVGTDAFNANAKGLPSHWLLTSHILNSDWPSATIGHEAFAQSAWDSLTSGGSMTVDWVRMWRQTGLSHFAPVSTQSDVNVDYGSSTIITLPAAATLWGATPGVEYLQAMPNEEIAPGMTKDSSFDQFPTGVSYNTGTRQLTVNVTTGNAGRVDFVMNAWNTAGSTCDHFRFSVNVGPNFKGTALSLTQGAPSTIDLYAAWDVGQLTPKVLTTPTGIPAGMTWDPSTGKITGTPTTVSSGTISTSCTNSAGQSRSTTWSWSVAAAVANYLSWTGPGLFDFTDATKVTKDGSNIVSAVTNLRTGSGDLTYGGSAGKVVYTAGVLNGYAALRVTRDISGSGQFLNTPRLSAPTASALSAMMQGTSKPCVVIMVFNPTDANAGIPWSWSHTISGSAVEHFGLLRRSSGNSSAIRTLTTFTEYPFQTVGLPTSSTAIILAVKFDGAKIRAWNTSLTPLADVTIPAVGAISASSTFRFLAGEATGTTAPTYRNVGMAMDLFEAIVDDVDGGTGLPRTDAEIQTAISFLAAKYGITLT